MRQEFFGPAGRVAHRQTGVAVILWEHDRHGQAIAESYLDTNERPTERTDVGVGKIEYRYNESGYHTYTATFSLAGAMRPWGEMGFAQTAVEFDRYGNELERKLLDANGSAVNHPLLGYAVVRRQYDGRGYLVRTEYLSAAGKLVRQSWERFGRAE